MNKHDLDKKKLMNEIETGDFIKLNGGIIRTFGNVLGVGWHKGSDLLFAFSEKDTTDLYSSLDYLQVCGAISVRERSSGESVDINEFDLEDVDIRLTAFGIKLAKHVVTDELIDV